LNTYDGIISGFDVVNLSPRGMKKENIDPTKGLYSMLLFSYEIFCLLKFPAF